MIPRWHLEPADVLALGCVAAVLYAMRSRRP